MTGQLQPCVVDASVGAKLFVTEEGSEAARALFAWQLLQPTPTLLVPDHFFAECANVLWKRVRRCEYADDVARANLQTLCIMGLQVTSSASLIDQAFGLACRYGIAVYDACYLALSETAKLPFLTADLHLAGVLADAPFDIIVLRP